MKCPYRIGTKIYLRPLEREDIPRLLPWINHPDITRTLQLYLPLHQPREEEFIDSLYKDPASIALGIALRAPSQATTEEEAARQEHADRLIGVTGIHEFDIKNRSANFGIVIGEPHFWNKGYGTETTRLMRDLAFGTLNANRFWLHVYENNPGGQRAYERAGFRVEGRLRQAHYIEGRYWDVLVMSILREEWEAAQARERGAAS